MSDEELIPTRSKQHHREKFRDYMIDARTALVMAAVHFEKAGYSEGIVYNAVKGIVSMIDNLLDYHNRQTIEEWMEAQRGEA